jgi:hypothetical protein
MSSRAPGYPGKEEHRYIFLSPQETEGPDRMYWQMELSHYESRISRKIGRESLTKFYANLAVCVGTGTAPDLILSQGGIIGGIMWPAAKSGALGLEHERFLTSRPGISQHSCLRDPEEIPLFAVFPFNKNGFRLGEIIKLS